MLITCPKCKNKHVISDHLKVSLLPTRAFTAFVPDVKRRARALANTCDLQIFADKNFTIEDLLRDKGELVKRGSIDTDGDVEFWENNGKVLD